MTHTAEAQAAFMNEKKFTGKHFLIAIVSFFGVIIAMNLAFVYVALDSWTGLSNPNAYVEGLRYNETLAAAEKQRALGWQSEVALEGSGSDRVLTFNLTDKAGQRLSGFTVTALVRRPTHEGLDQELTLAESAPGQYEAPLSLPQLGQWEVSLQAQAADGTPYVLQKRFTVK